MKVDLHQFLAQAPLPPNCTKWASSCALAIDDQGDIVGYANASDGSTHAILWVPRMGLTAVSGHSDCLPGGCCGVTLKWNRYNYGPEIPLVCYYHVYRSTTIDSGYTAIATNIVGEEWYWDDSTLPFTTYYYKIHPADCHDNEYPNLISGEANATTAPAPPANLSAAGGCRQVTLNWTASLGAVIYHVYRSTPSSDFTLIATINDGTAAAYTDQDKKLADNVTYIYKVDAANYASKSCSYSLVTAATRTAPSVYSAEGGYKEVTLKWRWPPFSPSVTGYNVGRATRSGGPYTSLGPVTTQSYTDTGVGIPAGLANNFQYYYVVSANLSPYGISCDSPEVSATTAATAPSALTSKLSKQSIVLHGVLSAGVVTYNVYRRTTSDSETLLETGLLTPDYTDTSSNLVAGMTYYYVVVGVNSDGLEVGSRLEESVVFNNVDIGLRLYDGTDIITIACEPPGTLTSPLRISKNGTNYGILLTETNSPDASKFRIQTSAGVKAWMKQP